MQNMANKTAKHKYLLPEIMPESKYVEAMKTTRLSTLDSTIAFTTDDSIRKSSNCNSNSMPFYCAFYVYFLRSVVLLVVLLVFAMLLASTL